MDVTIVGGHGRIARHLTSRLSARGDRVRGIIRDPSHAGDLRADGAEPVLLDLEDASVAAVTSAVSGSDAIVFAAGAGPGSGAARKETVDYGAAVKGIEAAQATGVGRYVMISAMGAKDAPDGDDVFSVYLRAKARADETLMGSGLAWTVVRPGKLTDEGATGLVAVGDQLPHDEIARGDVAEVLLAVLDEPGTAGQVFEVVAGDVPVHSAVAALASGPRVD